MILLRFNKSHRDLGDVWINAELITSIIDASDTGYYEDPTCFVFLAGSVEGVRVAEDAKTVAEAIVTALAKQPKQSE